MTVFEIKRGDTAPAFEKSLRDGLGQPVDISDSMEVDFHMRDVDFNTIVDDDTSGAVFVEEVPEEENGVVVFHALYQWQAGDTSDLGSYKAEFVVTFSDGTTQSFPRSGMYDIEVTEDIDD